VRVERAVSALVEVSVEVFGEDPISEMPTGEREAHYRFDAPVWNGSQPARQLSVAR
jgi:hypothetical protein